MRSFIVLTICLVFVSATPINNEDTSSEKDLINVVNELDNEQSVYLFGGLSIEKSKKGRSINSLPADATFLDRVERYFNTHELQFNWPKEDDKNEVESGRDNDNDDDDDDDDSDDSDEESRTRKLRKILLPLLLAIKLKLALVLPLLMLMIKAISLKGLAAGFLALLFSGATFFKEMLSSKKKEHITTAYITGHHPLNAEIVHSTDWHRSGQASAQELAYGGYNYHTVPASVY